ncbi:lysozyme inhibitor LprI family protein [Leclercia sp. AS011]|uniref:lysozyme inhibitor LprI family protein n=1 Tax=Leclercia sp. AS011 TaxID=3081257 RepID=UPI0030197ECD
MKVFVLLILTSFSAFSFENCKSENIKILERCAFDNYKKEYAYLNYLYNTIITTYPELKEDMKNTQRFWVNSRDSMCTYTSVDGEELPIYKNSCLYEQTYERNRELKAILSKQEVAISH